MLYTYRIIDAIKDLDAAGAAVPILTLLEPVFDFFHSFCLVSLIAWNDREVGQSVNRLAVAGDLDISRVYGIEDGGRLDGTGF